MIPYPTITTIRTNCERALVLFTRNAQTRTTTVDGRVLDVFSSDTMHFFFLSFCFFFFFCPRWVYRGGSQSQPGLKARQRQTKNRVEEASTPRELRTYVNGLGMNNTGAVFGMVAWRDPELARLVRTAVRVERTPKPSHVRRTKSEFHTMLRKSCSRYAGPDQFIMTHWEEKTP